MERYVLIAFSHPSSGQDAEYRRWYEQDHLPDVVAFPGVTSGQVFEPVEAHGFERRYLSIYEYDTDDPRALLDRLIAANGSEIRPSEAIDVDTLSMDLFRPITPRVTKRTLGLAQDDETGA